MFCPRCGDESPDEVRYCSSCGTELPKRSGDGSARTGDPAESGLKDRALARVKRLIGRNRRERVVSAVTAALVVIGVIAFLSLDPPEDDETSAARDTLDAACVAAKAQVVEAANALSGPGGASAYATGVVVAMMDLRDAAAASGLDGVEALRDAAFDAAVAAGRAGRVAREETSPDATSAAVQQSATALDGLSSPTEDLGLTTCTGASIGPSAG